ncbi:prephenate dehydratase [Corynebacterium uberis]|uniref:prephenate dehydratase n=1 Tax=Corynebacterium TaxID=1716 RepID=UPI001D0BAE88|nr:MULTISPECIES: prephenate dehydratase [Corynebacterium]MCZ9309577.1 prephenate dehydratase [Corynebacterium sp. c6VSa_13]UDL73388.1 prephenate dehydratase [Corynebacterium uberis]UDL75733.1 prephenate dehydratase [Corynebacterium uberis]UDL77945.1 prephenate dehydratase [Corynebacterium uberis]UDL80229.1 prephenate dehydratase [Corynebacterium uberis]
MTVSVAYLGPQGTFTYQAATALARAGVWGPNVDFHPADSPAACVALVRAGTCVGACLADESSVDGPVAQTLDALAGGGVEIVAETDLPIAFSILTRPGADTPRTVATHPVAHQQIRDWLREHLPDAEFLPASSNAAAAQLVAEGEADAAAAPAACAELFGLTTLASGVADVAAARTRFIAVRAADPATPDTADDTPRPGVDYRTALLFEVRNEPGSLARALAEFAERGVDLTRIVSRPTRTGMGTYRFHIDLAGHRSDAGFAAALASLSGYAQRVAVLGSWPVATGDQR